MKTPIFVALDVDSDKEALKIVEETKEFVGGYKIGPRLAVRYGAGLLTRMAKEAPLFIDNKYFDIPNTMEGAIRASFEMGASFATIHAQAGGEAMSRLAKVEQELNEERPFKILAVTVLTSFSAQTLPKILKPTPIAEMVRELANLTIDSGLSGLVCSPEEVAILRKEFPKAYLLVPGIRLGKVAGDDQERIADPASTLKNGASALVVGRPIVAASSPRDAAKQFAAAIT